LTGDLRIGNNDASSNGCLENSGGTGLVGTCASDINLKTNIISLGDLSDTFSKINFVNYNWNATSSALFGNNQTATNTGVIAQEIETLFPELVVTGSDGYKRVDYTTLNMYGLKATAEQGKLIHSLASTTADKFASTTDSLTLLGSAFASSTASTTANILEVQNALASSTASVTDLAAAVGVQIGKANARIDVLANEIATLASSTADIASTTNANAKALSDFASTTNASLQFLNAQGSTTISYASSTDGIALDDLVAPGLLVMNADTYFKGHIYQNKDAAGVVVIPAGATSTAITYAHAYKGAPVVTTSMLGLNENVTYGIVKNAKEGFTLAISATTTQDISFSWNAVPVLGSSADFADEVLYTTGSSATALVTNAVSATTPKTIVSTTPAVIVSPVAPVGTSTATTTVVVLPVSSTTAPVVPVVTTPATDTVVTTPAAPVVPVTPVTPAAPTTPDATPAAPVTPVTPDTTPAPVVSTN
jgi:hypothetical protein